MSMRVANRRPGNGTTANCDIFAQLLNDPSSVLYIHLYALALGCRPQHHMECQNLSQNRFVSLINLFCVGGRGIVTLLYFANIWGHGFRG